MIVGHDPVFCCEFCKTGGCIRHACPGDGCPCVTRGEPHGHVPAGDALAAQQARLIASMPPVDGPAEGRSLVEIVRQMGLEP